MTTSEVQPPHAIKPAVHRLTADEFRELVLSRRMLSRIRWLPSDLLGLVDRNTAEIFVIKRTALQDDVALSHFGKNDWFESLEWTPGVTSWLAQKEKRRSLWRTKCNHKLLT